MNIPKRFRGKSLRDFIGLTDEVNKAAAAIAGGRSVFISGPCGTGKTHMALGLLFEWYARQLSARGPSDRAVGIFLPAAELFVELKQCYQNDASEAEVLQRYSKADLLLLDDLGAEKISDWSRQIFYLIIDRRYREIRQTIITSNLSLGKISELVDDRIASRIAEMGEIIKIESEDRRLP